MGEVTFECDAMLGSLARWLRFAGYDTEFSPDRRGRAAAAAARAAGRWLLTRDRALASSSGPRVLLLNGPGLAAMVGELRSRLDLAVDPARFLTRCAACNGALRDLSPAAAVARVPPYVAAHAHRFRTCAACGRVYWEGSHVGRIAARLDALFVAPQA